MVDPLELPSGFARTGHFIFRVWRKDGGAWNWRLRVEAIDSGACGVFDSMQDALWFMREHLAVDEDAEAEAEGQPELGVPSDGGPDDPGGADEPEP